MCFTAPAFIVICRSAMASSLNQSARVGVMRFSALGDLAAALPVLRAMQPVPTIITSPLGRELFQDEFPDFIVLANKSGRAAIRCIRDVRARHFDCLVDLQCNDRSRLLRTLAGRGAVLTNHGIPSWRPTTNVLYDVVQPTGCVGPLDLSFTPKTRTFIVLHVGSSPAWASKRLPLRKWEEISRCLHDRFGLPFVLTGAPDEQPYVIEVARSLVGSTEVVAGKTSVPELKRLLADAWLTVSTDSGPMHLSAAMKTPTIGLFGPTNWIRSAPFGPWAVALYDRVFYPTGEPPWPNRRDAADYFQQLDITAGLTKLASYLEKPVAR